jgi:hypothetical protein
VWAKSAKRIATRLKKDVTAVQHCCRPLWKPRL